MAENKKTDARKQSLYFSEETINEMKSEAARLDRSLSWVVSRAWTTARAEIKKMASITEEEEE
jgi:uncharacterized small protein (TIGR04563 family)